MPNPRDVESLAGLAVSCMAVLLVWTAKLHDCQETVFDIALTLGALEGSLMKSKVACILVGSGRASS